MRDANLGEYENASEDYSKIIGENMSDFDVDD